MTTDITCENYGYCCQASSYFFILYDVRIYPLNVILAIGMCLSSVFLLVKLLVTVIRLNKQVVLVERDYLINEIEEQVGNIIKPNRKQQPLLPVYYGYLFIVGMWLLLQGVSLAMIKESFGILLVHLLQDGHALIDNTIIVFAFYKGTDKKTITNALCICSIPTLIRAVSTFIYTSLSGCQFCSFYFPGPYMIYVYGLSVIVYVIILFLMFSKSKYSPRATLQWWLIYLVVIYLIGAIGLLLVYYFAKDLGICVVDIISLVYVLSYSPMIYITAIKDSKFLLDEYQNNNTNDKQFITASRILGDNYNMNNNMNNNVNDNNNNYNYNNYKPSHKKSNKNIVNNEKRQLEIDRLLKYKNVQYNNSNKMGRREYLRIIIKDFNHKEEVLDLLTEHPSITWININDIRLGKRIGFGGFAEVRKGDWHGSRVAVKILYHNHGASLRSFFREVKVMSQLHHPNILLFMGICVDKDHRYIITELMSKGSVFDHIHSEKLAGQITGERIKRILVHSAMGILYLHSINPPILHRDLKSHNLLIDDNWTIKVADFGLSRAKVANTMTFTGTPQWSAPEVIRKENYSEKADVFSFGVIIYELLTGRIPYDDMPSLDMLNSIGKYESLLQFPDDIEPLCAPYIQLARNCWNTDPDLRPSFSEILQYLTPLPPPQLSTPYIELHSDNEELK